MPTRHSRSVSSGAVEVGIGGDAGRAFFVSNSAGTIDHLLPTHTIVAPLRTDVIGVCDEMRLGPPPIPTCDVRLSFHHHFLTGSAFEALEKASPRSESTARNRSDPQLRLWPGTGQKQVRLRSDQLSDVFLLKPHFATDIVANKAKNATKIPDGIVVWLPSLLYRQSPARTGM